jgi:hypothetical protein
MELHAYLIGTIGLAIVFSCLCSIRRDLLRLMIYSGLLYLLFMSLVFVLLKILSSDPAKAITPGYWSPPSLLNLNRTTGGYGIEDAFYMFFVGAIAAGLYDIMFNIKITLRSYGRLKKGHVLAGSLLISAALYYLTPINAVDFFIIFQLLGGLGIIWQRRDLVLHAVAGAILFMGLYVFLFAVFKILFPTFLNSYYHLENTSQVWIHGIPLEEYLYSLSLGFMWAPIYEYEHKLSEKGSIRRSLGPRRAYPVAGGARR